MRNESRTPASRASVSGKHSITLGSQKESQGLALLGYGSPDPIVCTSPPLYLPLMYHLFSGRTPLVLSRALILLGLSVAGGVLLSPARTSLSVPNALGDTAPVWGNEAADTAEPHWIGPSGPTAHADSLIAVLKDAPRDGLRPADYHVPTLDSLRSTLRSTYKSSGTLDERLLAEFDRLCTDAFLRYGSHLLQGNVDPVKITPTWTFSQRQTDLRRRLVDALENGTIRDAFDELRPDHPEYVQLTRALQRYRRLAAAGGWPALSDGPKLEMGAEGDRVATLRARLRATEDLTATEEDAPEQFDAPLKEAVGRFQKRHGLEPDGVVGGGTQTALNVPVERRIEQLEVNLERWRWLPADLSERYVLVNIAGFSLRVMEGQTEGLRMRVVTGKPYRQTPVFSDAISYLAFSPYWHVPPRLASRDKLPEFQRNPDLVSQQGFEVFRGWEADAQPIGPATIDWSSLSAANFPYRLRQKPGAQNALGQVKFMFPNRHNVYLHDTPSRVLFAQSERGFSSGCIRVEKPAELAEYLLRDNEGWTPQRIRGVMGQDREQTVVLRKKVPVHLLYWTSWMEDDAVQFRSDIYKRDAGVASALSAPPPSPSDRTDAGGARWSP